MVSSFSYTVGQNTTKKVEQSKEITADGDIFGLKLGLHFRLIILKTGQLSFVSIDQ
jgi:hypothetical protein